MRARFLFLERLCDWKLPAAFGDPRIFQILFLGILLAAGAWLRDFSLSSAQIILTFAAAMTAQHLSFAMRPDAPAIVSQRHHHRAKPHPVVARR